MYIAPGIDTIWRRLCEVMGRPELGFTFSVGLVPNKVLAKIGSKWEKPSGLTIIPGRRIHVFLQEYPVEKIWGIGARTAALLAKRGMRRMGPRAGETLRKALAGEGSSPIRNDVMPHAHVKPARRLIARQARRKLV